MPTGFLYKIRLLSTWGDFDYVGLNGIELYDHKGEPLLNNKKSRDYKMAAEPSSVTLQIFHSLLQFLLR